MLVFIQLTFILIGAALMMAFSSKHLRVYKIHELQILFSHPSAWLFLLLYATFFFVTLPLSCVCLKYRIHSGSQFSEHLLP